MLNKLGAKQIWVNHEVIPNQYVLFKRSFSVNSAAAANLYICADTQYACYINSEFAGCGQYSGIKTEKFYDTIDVTKYIKNGENEILICAYFQGRCSVLCDSLSPMLIYALDLSDNVIVSGENTLCKIDNRYKNGEI